MSGAPYDTFAGVPLTFLNLSIPLVGLWVADVHSSAALPFPPVGPLVHGNLTLQGGVYRQATFAGITTARIAGGFGGWSKTLTPRGYSQPFGVLLSQVLNDAALEVQEAVTVVLDQPIGTFWSRPSGPAGRTLRAAAGSSWSVQASGIVNVGPRIPQPIVSPWQVLAWDGAGGILDLATEDQASWQPGNTFASALVPSLQTVSLVRHTSEAGKSRMRVMISP
jgi:hypothetical protein